MMAGSQGGTCKGKCQQFKAKRTASGARYGQGQYRCQTCEIFLTKHGLNKNYCKCCNVKVRTKPRNTHVKEKYYKRIAGGSHKTLAENDPTHELKVKPNHSEEPRVQKRSAPIQSKADSTGKSFHELKNFLKAQLDASTNHTMVMIKELAEYKRLHMGEIAESLAYFNNRDSSDIAVVKGYFFVPAYDELLERRLIIADMSGNIPHYRLNARLNEYERMDIIQYLAEAISEYNAKHGIPENVHQGANNMGSIKWDRVKLDLIFGA